MLTEDEARQRWCPMVRVTRSPNGKHYTNRSEEDGARHASCIGSQCMAWRWVDQAKETRDFEKMGQKPEGDGWICTLPDRGREKFFVKSTWERANPCRRGYCGLAGRGE